MNSGLYVPFGEYRAKMASGLAVDFLTVTPCVVTCGGSWEAAWE